MKKILKDLHKVATTQTEKFLIETTLISVEDAPSRRPRCSYFGEMLQMNASVHLWFGETKTQLHIAVDDCTGTVVGAYFDSHETLKGYYNVFYQILNNYGIPNMFYTDNRTIFEYKTKKMKHLGKDTFTQFTYAYKQLGVEVKTTSIAQAKGRVERLFQTLQSQGLQVHYYKGTKDLVIKTFDRQFLFSTNDKVYILEEILLHEKTSRNFDFKPMEEKPIKRKIPDAKHPWRNTTFLKHVSHKLPESEMTA